jgi:hypothetical protein
MERFSADLQGTPVERIYYKIMMGKERGQEDPDQDTLPFCCVCKMRFPIGEGLFCLNTDIFYPFVSDQAQLLELVRQYNALPVKFKIQGNIGPERFGFLQKAYHNRINLIEAGEEPNPDGNPEINARNDLHKARLILDPNKIADVGISEDVAATERRNARHFTCDSCLCTIIESQLINREAYCDNNKVLKCCSNIASAEDRIMTGCNSHYSVTDLAFHLAKCDNQVLELRERTNTWCDTRNLVVANVPPERTFSYLNPLSWFKRSSNIPPAVAVAAVAAADGAAGAADAAVAAGGEAEEERLRNEAERLRIAEEVEARRIAEEAEAQRIAEELKRANAQRLLELQQQEQTRFEAEMRAYRSLLDKKRKVRLIKDEFDTITNGNLHMFPECPKCHVPIMGFDGCFAIKCGDKHSKWGRGGCDTNFCGFCMRYFSESSPDTHEHCRHCPQNQTVDHTYYGQMRDFYRCRQIEYQPILNRALDAIDREIKPMVLYLLNEWIKKHIRTAVLLPDSGGGGTVTLALLPPNQQRWLREFNKEIDELISGVFPKDWLDWLIIPDAPELTREQRELIDLYHRGIVWLEHRDVEPTLRKVNLPRTWRQFLYSLNPFKREQLIEPEPVQPRAEVVHAVPVQPPAARLQPHIDLPQARAFPPELDPLLQDVEDEMLAHIISLSQEEIPAQAAQAAGGNIPPPVARRMQPPAPVFAVPDLTEEQQMELARLLSLEEQEQRDRQFALALQDHPEQWHGPARPFQQGAAGADVMPQRLAMSPLGPARAAGEAVNPILRRQQWYIINPNSMNPQMCQYMATENGRVWVKINGQLSGTPVGSRQFAEIPILGRNPTIGHWYRLPEGQYGKLEQIRRYLIGDESLLIFKLVDGTQKSIDSKNIHGGTRKKWNRKSHRKGLKKSHRKGLKKSHRKGLKKSHRKGLKKSHRKGLK